MLDSFAMCGKIHGTSENLDDRQSRTPGFACLSSSFPAHEKFMQNLTCDACPKRIEVRRLQGIGEARTGARSVHVRYMSTPVRRKPNSCNAEFSTLFGQPQYGVGGHILGGVDKSARWADSVYGADSRWGKSVKSSCLVGLLG